MQDDHLLMKLIQSPDPLLEIDKLRGELTIEFVEFLNRTAGGLAQQRQLVQALTVSDWAVHIARMLGDSVMEAHTLFNRSQYERAHGDLGSAEESVRAAMLLYDEHCSTQDLLDGAALLLETLADANKPEMIAREAESILDKLMSADQITGAIQSPLVKISQTLAQQGERTLARNFFDLLLQLAEQSGDQEGEAAACAMLAETYVDEDNAEAARLFERALTLDRLNDDMRNLVADLGNLGFLSYRLGSLEAAAQYFAECIALRDREGLTMGLEMDLFRYYHVCHYLGQREEALKQSTRFIELNTGATRGFSMSPLIYHIHLNERGEELDEVQFGRR